MKEDNGQHRNGAQPFDVTPKSRALAPLTGCATYAFFASRTCNRSPRYAVRHDIPCRLAGRPPRPSVP
ncbi:hypothetical protein MBOU_02250 [Mycobacterium bourgelatii]|uniref:Uncharacterized protein n=1 Tax=Mycobacterium bourgelatii TaxID=1273442 RepID=A0A7I9YI58_MYCBU|nr:hypothetical protein MBOU_02250 [Mycobacterium bourgelatii]